MVSLRGSCIGVLAAGFIIFAAPVWAQDELGAAVMSLENHWVQIRYHTPDNAQKLEGGRALAAQAAALAARYPDRVEPLVWQAFGLLIEPEVNRDLSAIGIVKKAKALLEKAEAMDPAGMNGVVHATLGTLYYEVPGWPVAFGDNKQAAEYLKKALAINPDGMDPNYFYGDYLLQRGKGREALPYLEKAMQTPLRPGHEAADTNRKTDIQEALVAARKAR